LTFFLAWIPVVNVAAFFLTCVLICFQYTSYPQTRRGVGIKDGVRFLFQYFYSCLGFGMVLIALFSVPFFSCFMLPLAVVGGTLLVARAQKIPELPLLR